MAQRKFGPYELVNRVDVTGLRCNVRVFYAGEARTMPVVEGPLLQIARVRVRPVVRNGLTRLVLTGGRGAAAAPGESLVRTHVIHPNDPFRYDVGSPVTVALFVREGARVLY